MQYSEEDEISFLVFANEILKANPKIHESVWGCLREGPLIRMQKYRVCFGIKRGFCKAWLP